MKNPFAAGDTSGITGMLVGVIILVFTTLGIALLVEKEIKLPTFSSSDALVSKNDSLQSEINHLEIQIAARERKEKESKKHREQVQLVLELEQQIDAARKEVGIIRRLIKNEQESMELITQGKENHRLRYREQVRTNAVGQTYPKITTRRGKEYQDVRIKSVTELGISISHKDGASRLGYHDMPLEWQQKLMYSAVEVAEATAAERKRQIAARAISDRREKAYNDAQKTESVARQIATLRRQIAATSMRYSTAQLEASLARNKVTYQQNLSLSRNYARSSYRYYNTTTGRYYQSSYRPRYRITLNGSKSVPGSLETWEQRAVRYERAKSKYGIQLATLRSRLAALDPTYSTQPAVAPRP